MRKITWLSALVLVLVLVWSGIVAAAEPELVSALVLTRGEFAALLVEGAELEGDLPPAELLMEKGIMQGYPDGGTYLDQGITRMEAVALAAKTLGLDSTVAPPGEVEVPLPEDHWGYNFYAWFVRQGLVEGDPGTVLTPEEGKAFLDKVFGFDPEAVALLEKAQAEALEMEEVAVRMVMGGKMKIIPRAQLDMEAMGEIGMEMKLIQEVILPDRIHQVTNMIMTVPGEEGLEITTETYIADGKMYQKIPDPETGEPKWFQQPEALMPDTDEILAQAQQAEAIPEGLEKYLHYHLLGTTEVDGEEVYVLSLYGRIDDFNDYFDVALGQFGGSGEFQQAMGPMLDLMESMSYWGIEYLGVDDLKVRSSDITFIINYAEEFMGEAVPVEAAVMSMQVEEYDYDADITIEVPAEALSAPVLDLTLPAEEEALPADA